MLMKQVSNEFKVLQSVGIMALLSLFALNGAQAQTTVGAQTFSTASGQAGQVSFVCGQPFFQQTTNVSGVEVSEGVCQAQIVYDTIVLAGCQNEENVSPDTLVKKYDFFKGYTGTIAFNGENLHILPAGHYDSTDLASRHYNWDGPFNYDSVTTMVLDVWPIYEVYDTLRLDLSDMRGYDEGDNDRILQTVHECDSLVHYYVLTCGDSVEDFDGNTYYSLFVGPYCWFQQNLQSEHYSNPEGLPAPNRIYYSPEYSNTSANLAQYGRLYTWYAAVGLPEGSTNSPTTDEYGLVQGLCPDGWHIPTERNVSTLAYFGAPALKSENLWLQPGDNSAGFTSYPAGFYNPNTNRYENLLGETRYWTDQNSGTESAWNCSISSCDELLTDVKTGNYGFSIRCVKTQKGNL